uniref:CUB domain-containing protein n=1 Tax=Tetradesmus obliquus TaxID=3088 RepID=A0A383W2I6_TETOB|eukprot:jgi/Sobl393_1/4965/SZX70866.1
MDQQNFTVPAPLCDASTTLTDAKGVIVSHKQATSPDELEDYKPHSQCEWVLPTLAVGGKVVIEATFVDLEPLFDTLTVVDGGGLLASIGAPQNVTLIQEGTSPMRLKFKSDASFRYKGFFLEYQTEPPAAITEAEQAYNVTFAIIVTGQEMTYSALSSESSTARQTLTAAISSTFGVYKSQVQITVTAPAKHRRSLLQDKTALAILQGSRAPMSNVAVTVAGVSNAHSQDIVSAVADGTLDQSVETQLEAAGIASTVSVFQMPKVVKPQPPTPSPAPQQLGVSDASTGSGTYISNKSRSTSDIVVSKKMPIGPIVGAAVGAITLLVGAVAGIVVRKRRQAQQANSTQATQPGYAVAPAGYASMPAAAAAAAAAARMPPQQGPGPAFAAGMPAGPANGAPMMYYAQPAPGSAPPAAAPPAPYTKA